jgi:uncharacterized repeat protein (TIGR03803 family)
LLLSGNTLYGTTYGGGGYFGGTVFAVNTNGSDFKVLHVFDPHDPENGSSPFSGLIISGSSLYGTTDGGGGRSSGTVFALNTDGSCYTNLHSFTSGYNAPYTNSDGSYPQAGLVLSGNTLYGLAWGGGPYANGTVFALSLVPSLRIVDVENQVILSWPTWQPNFYLQTTTNLAMPYWSVVPGKPGVVNDQYTVTNAVSGTQQYYRLSQ